MEFRDAVKNFRSELGLTQTELASVLRINYTTVGRWEGGRTFPNRSVQAALLEYAHARSVTEACYQNLKQSVNKTAKNKLEQTNGELFSVEHSSLSQLIDEASFAIYVCDMETDELLYMNHKAEAESGRNLTDNPGMTCYECFMHRDTPCPFCHKNELKADQFTGTDAFRPETKSFHRIYGKLIQWRGHHAQIRYVYGVSGDINISEQKVHEVAYRENLRIRKQNAAGAIASACYNLTQNTVSDIECQRETWYKIIQEEGIDQVLQRIHDKNICDRNALINLYYKGKTHITLQHYIEGLKGYYEGTFDLMQNPVTFDIEAFAVLHDITEETLQSEVVETLFQMDYESISLLDTDTGEAHPFLGDHIHEVIQVQKECDNPVTGVETYLRRYCIDDDIDRVIRETSLKYIKTKLETAKTHTVAYTLLLNGKKIHKRVLYTYLNENRQLILCAMQNVTDTYRERVLQQDRLAEAVKTLQEVGGMNIARYDLQTKEFYSACEITRSLGYGDVIENVPDVFIQDGNVAKESIFHFREFFEKLRRGEAATMSPYLRVTDGGFHLFKANSRIIYNEEGECYQAIVVFQDIEEMRDQSVIYQKIKEMLKNKDPQSYQLFRGNLSRGSELDKVEGNLTEKVATTGQNTLYEVTSAYAEQFVHPDDREAYLNLIQPEALLQAYHHGIKQASIIFREKTDVKNTYRWMKLSIELAQYPDCTDIEIFLMIQLDE